MRPVERKIGLHIVIEAPCQPVHGHMAERAVATEARLVNVILEVAIVALLGRIEIRMSLVAIVAFGLVVLAEQRKLCKVMIEPNLVRPRQLGMAARTVVAELLLVRIVVLVSGRLSATGSTWQSAHSRSA